MDGEFWFRPHTFGYGATPVTWEGWAVVAVYLVVMAAIATLRARSKNGFRAWAAWGVAIMVATSALILVSWSKTDGAWQWRWGNVENSGNTS
jgi:hypothetical protein